MADELLFEVHAVERNANSAIQSGWVPIVGCKVDVVQGSGSRVGTWGVVKGVVFGFVKTGLSTFF